MSTSDPSTVGRLSGAITLMRLGSLGEAREVVSALSVTTASDEATCAAQLLELIDSLAGQAQAKASALAAMQAALWDLRSAQESLRAHDARFRTTLESLGDGLISTDTHGRVEFINAVASRLTGWTATEAIGQPIAGVFRLIDSLSRADAPNPTWHALQGGTTTGLSDPKLLIARDGAERQVADNCAPIRDNDGCIVGAVLAFRDVTAERRRHDQLLESEIRFRTLFDSAAEGILVADQETSAFLYANKTWCEMFGFRADEIVGLRAPDIHPSAELPKVLGALGTEHQGQKRSATSVACLRKDGSVFFADIVMTSVQLDGRPCSIGFFADVSERQAYEQRLESERALRGHMEVELRQAQKLEAVGQLASGIAHEINTPAQYVGDSIHFLKDILGDLLGLIVTYRESIAQLTQDPEHQEIARQLREAEEAADLAYIQETVPSALDSAIDGISRIANIVNAMKEFAHPDRSEKSPTDLNRALQNTLVIARNEYKYVANVETVFGDLPQVVCHVGDLNQVFLNLLVNAAHAIADAGGSRASLGRIHVQTGCDGNTVRIDIADTGCGIPENIRTRVFEPFFTTKAVGRGSGQGLAVARSIVVDKHGGMLTFATEVGKGTTFTIRLPVDGGSAHAKIEA